MDLFYRRNCPIPLRQRLVRRRHKKIEPTVNGLLSETKTPRPPVKKQLLIVIHWLSNCKLYNSNTVSQQFSNGKKYTIKKTFKNVTRQNIANKWRTTAFRNK